MQHLQKHNKGIKVKPRNRNAISGLANAFRKKVCRTEGNECLDVLELIELTLPKLTDYEFEFLLKEVKEMGDIEAAMLPDQMKMYLRRDVYNSLHANDPRARFTIAHELGHFVLHEGIALARGSATAHKVYEDSEWQANTFAAELLAPIGHCLGLTENEIMAKFGVSRQCALLRLKEISKR